MSQVIAAPTVARAEEGLFYALPYRIVLFMFLGLGWDVFVTFTQQLVAGKLGKDAICPASAWMYFSYGLQPLVLVLICHLMRRTGWPYLLRLPLLLLAFYATEYNLAYTFHNLGITAWDYRWWMAPMWSSSNGYICWHPVIVVEWIVFLYLIERIDLAAKEIYPTVKKIILSHPLK